MNVGVNLDVRAACPACPAMIKPTLVGISSSNGAGQGPQQPVRQGDAGSTSRWCCRRCSTSSRRCSATCRRSRCRRSRASRSTTCRSRRSRRARTSSSRCTRRSARARRCASSAQHDPFAARAVADARRRAAAAAGRASTGHAHAASTSSRRRPRRCAARCCEQQGGALPIDHVRRRSLRQPRPRARVDVELQRRHVARVSRPASPLVISDRAFAWQGKYKIGLKSRVKGDYRTVST